MSTGNLNGPISVDVFCDPELFREALRTAGYTQDALAATLGISHPTEKLNLPVTLRRTESPSAYHTLVRLFFLAQVVPEEAVRSAVMPVPLEQLIRCGLLENCPGGVRSIAKLVPFGDLFFISDFSSTERTPGIAQDHVLGVGPASVTLSNLTVRKKAASVFDLGCGSGIQTILAAGHAGRLVGSDTNARALNFAAFNARLNGIENVEWRTGSFFEPVGDEKFDLFVANPPFVISPRSRFMYRDSGLSGDAVSEHVVRGAAQRLNEGGFASMLINWLHDNEEDWPDRPREWCEGNGCDSWIIRSSDADPLAYSANWLGQTDGQDNEEFGRLLDEWLVYFEKLGIKRLSSGAVILRKRTTGKNWFRADSMEQGSGRGQCSDHILRVFVGEDWLQNLDDRQLMERRLKLHPETVVNQRLCLEHGNWAIEALRISLSAGLGFGGNGDVAVMRLLSKCDGEQSLAAVAQSLATELKSTLEAMTPTCIEVARKMVKSGILIPVDGGK